MVLLVLPFPAGAGMNRHRGLWAVGIYAVPRRRGDEPSFRPIAILAVSRSPQARG